MEAFRHDSYCGLYCGACEVLNLYRDALDRGNSASWEDLPQALKDVIPPSPVRCAGCKTDTLSPGCKACVTRLCASQRKVEACVLCAEYPCQLVVERKAYISENLLEVLPHIKVKFSQAERIREIGYESWREEQAEAWKCPSCGASFTWYQERCGKCGRSFEGLKEQDTVRP